MIVIGRDSTPYTITGICKNVPENSHLRFNMLKSYQTLISSYHWTQADYDFTDSDFWHYVRLKKGADYKKLQAKLDAFSQRHFQGNKISGSDEKFYLQPLSKAHLYSDFEYEIGETGSATVVWGLLIIAIFIILIAWVNYINLATARSLERAKEVGIRKVVGSMRKQLMSQFMTESVIANVFSLLLAFVLVFTFQSTFNRLVQHELSLSYLFQKGLNGYTIAIGLMLLLITGILASGFYPAVVLSSFKPIQVLKGNYSTSKRGILLRKGLVVAQFGITVALMIGSFVVYRQINFMNRTALGFNMDQLMIIKPPVLTEWDSTFINRTNQFKEELKQLTHVKGAATSWSVPGGDIGRSFNVRRADSGSLTRNTVRHTGIDYNFLNVYEVKILAGRNFLPTDHNPDFSKLHNIIINKMAASLLGFSSPQDAIGKSILRGDRKWEVVGVVDNYHQKSLKYPLEPMIFLPAYSTNSDITVKISPADVPSTIDVIKKKYDAFFPGNLFDYTFLDERFNRQYKDEQLFGKVFGIFAGFAIFIACLGLFGLSLFSTMQRTKEIGVRKVLGASVSNIVFILSKDFMRLIIFANLIAFPIAWWIMNSWLRDFAYRIHLSWWIFALAAIIALLIAAVTISLQTIRASIANPVNSLRNE
jgi:putative ABC transport system permease protein